MSERVKKVVLFNGPPRCGKDTATDLSISILGHTKAGRYRFAEPLKDAVHSLFGMSNVLLEHFDSVKGDPQESLFGMTPRDAYIWMSEEVVKPKFGTDFFARIAVRRINHVFGKGPYGDFTAVVISDCGFQSEIDLLSKEFGAENVLLVRLHRVGRTFAGDSRSYIEHSNSIDLENDGTMGELKERLTKILEEFHVC